MFKWNSIADRIRAESESAKTKRDRMRLSRYYQSLLDSGEASTLAEIARWLGVSPARLTQVLNRLVADGGHDTCDKSLIDFVLIFRVSAWW